MLKQYMNKCENIYVKAYYSGTGPWLEILISGFILITYLALNVSESYPGWCNI